MALLCIDVTAADLRSGLGYRLRAAIDIVNALCACRGFAPHRNGRFWRHAVSTLWIEYAARPALTQDPQREGGFLFQPPAHYMLPFGESAFSLFTVESEKYPPTRLEATLAELWRLIAWTDVTAKCPRALMEAHAAVITDLSKYAVHPVRTLQLEMKIPDNMNYVDRGDSERHRTTPEVWNWRPLRAALEACVHPSTSAMATRGKRAASLNTPHVISISNRQNRGFRWRFALYTTNLREVRQLIASSPPSIQCLTLDATFVEDEDENRCQDQLVWFEELLHTLLVERRSLRTLRLEGDLHEHIVAAVCSILPVSSCLEGLVVFDYDEAEEASWLSYALHHPRRASHTRSNLLLDADCDLDPPLDGDRMTSLSVAQQKGIPCVSRH